MLSEHIRLPDSIDTFFPQLLLILTTSIPLPQDKLAINSELFLKSYTITGNTLKPAD